jgi:hypothetical protein
MSQIGIYFDAVFYVSFLARTLITPEVRDRKSFGIVQ